MSTQPPQSPQPAPNTSTRQLLDELDDLMQRMLALPVHHLDDEPAPSEAAVVPTVAPPPPLSAPVMHALLPAPPENDPPDPPADPPPPRQEAPPVAAPRLPRVYAPRGRHVGPPVRAAVPAWFLWPLIWGNRAFDRGTAWFGGPGRWLRSPAGRTLLGWAGLLLLGLAIAWGILKWIG